MIRLRTSVVVLSSITALVVACSGADPSTGPGPSGGDAGTTPTSDSGTTPPRPDAGSSDAGAADSGQDAAPPAQDTDGDGIPDPTDNCPAVKNADQLDTDKDARATRATTTTTTTAWPTRRTTARSWRTSTRRTPTATARATRASTTTTTETA